MNATQTRYIIDFYSKTAKLVSLNKQIKYCRKCTGLNIPDVSDSAPGYGNPMSPIFFVGQSLCAQCMDTQIPFTRGSGDILDEVFMSVGRMKYDFFISNVLHCHPHKNRASDESEIKNCMPFLTEEIRIVSPKVIVTLGKDAEKAVDKFFIELKEIPFIINLKHPAYFLYKRDKVKLKEYKAELKRILNVYSN